MAGEATLGDIGNGAFGDGRDRPDRIGRITPFTEGREVLTDIGIAGVVQNLDSLMAPDNCHLR
jgi:hypothetical protein